MSLGLKAFMFIACYIYFGYCSSSSQCESDDTIERPNILFILVDDLEMNDISFNGGQFPTIISR